MSLFHFRWLIASDRPEEATEIIKKAAKVNGKSVPGHMLAHTDDGQGGTVGMTNRVNSSTRLRCRSLSV